MNCPRDNSLLHSDKKGRIDINQCDQCYGFSVVLHQEAARALEAQLERYFARDSYSAVEDSLDSPYTSRPMRRFVYRGVSLDYCDTTHSIWFDRGEYSKMFVSESYGKEGVPPGTITSDDLGADALDAAITGTFVLDLAGDILTDLASGADFF